MLASMIFKKEPFFNSTDNNQQLEKIAKVLGTDGLYSYLAKYSLKLESALANQVGRHSRKPWESFINDSNRHLANSSSIDLLDKLLRYDGQERLTAQEAMAHHFFDPVRKMTTV